ncbi:MAG: hypothetical protein M3O70_05900 [Actinomycetota bacterium]|nr:hypothetical protein [Actinomycetota bacterium]
MSPHPGRAVSHSSRLHLSEDTSVRLAADLDLATRSSSRRRDFSHRAGAGDSD